MMVALMTGRAVHLRELDAVTLDAINGADLGTILADDLHVFLASRHTLFLLAAFSRRTPLNFFAVFLTAMNWPPFLFRFVEVFVSGFLSWVRFFTAPLRA